MAFLKLQVLQGGIRRLLNASGVPLALGGSDEGAALAVSMVSAGAASATYSPRSVIIVPPTSSANQLVQVSATSVPFVKAYFYGLKAVAATVNGTAGNGRTANTGTVTIGEKDPGTGTVYMLDDVTNDPTQAVKVYADAGESFDLKDFWVWVPTSGDGLTVKYNP